jgi:hypothetical protein
VLEAHVLSSVSVALLDSDRPAREVPR